MIRPLTFMLTSAIILILFCPVEARPLKFFSPDEKWCSAVKPLNGTQAVQLTLKGPGQPEQPLASVPPPAEVHIDNSGSWLLLIYPSTATDAIRLYHYSGNLIGSWRKSDLGIKRINPRVPWHEFEQTGFLKDDLHFQLTLRRGTQLWINLETARLVQLQNPAELYDMGWNH